MNAQQQSLISIIARYIRIPPEEVKPQTKLGYSSVVIGIHFVALHYFVTLHYVSLQVDDIENCTVQDLLQQLA